MTTLRPCLTFALLAWQRFLLRTVNPLAPQVPALVLRINRLERK